CRLGSFTGAGWAEQNQSHEFLLEFCVFLTFSDYAAMQQFLHAMEPESANSKSIYNLFMTISRTRSRSSCVSTPVAGWPSVTRQAIERRFSRARSCSSDSKDSSGPTGRPGNRARNPAR